MHCTCGVGTREHTGFCVVTSPTASAALHHHADRHHHHHNYAECMECNMNYEAAPSWSFMMLSIGTTIIHIVHIIYNICFEGWSSPGMALSTTALLSIGTLCGFWQRASGSKLWLLRWTLCDKKYGENVVNVGIFCRFRLQQIQTLIVPRDSLGLISYDRRF